MSLWSERPSQVLPLPPLVVCNGPLLAHCPWVPTAITGFTAKAHRACHWLATGPQPEATDQKPGTSPTCFVALPLCDFLLFLAVVTAFHAGGPLACSILFVPK